MVHEDGIAHVLPETAAQMICGALARAEWRQILEGDISHTVCGDAATGTCIILSGVLTVSLSMTATAIGSDDERITGRRVRFSPTNSEGVASAQAAVMSIGEQAVPAQQSVGAVPVLTALACMDDLDAHHDLPGLLRRLLVQLQREYPKCAHLRAQARTGRPPAADHLTRAIGDTPRQSIPETSTELHDACVITLLGRHTIVISLREVDVFRAVASGSAKQPGSAGREVVRSGMMMCRPIE